MDSMTRGPCLGAASAAGHGGGRHGGATMAALSRIEVVAGWSAGIVWAHGCWTGRATGRAARRAGSRIAPSRNRAWQWSQLVGQPTTGASQLGQRPGGATASRIVAMGPVSAPRTNQVTGLRNRRLANQPVTGAQMPTTSSRAMGRSPSTPDTLPSDAVRPSRAMLPEVARQAVEDVGDDRSTNGGRLVRARTGTPAPRCAEHALCHRLVHFLSVFERSGPYDRGSGDRYFRSKGTYAGAPGIWGPIDQIWAKPGKVEAVAVS